MSTDPGVAEHATTASARPVDERPEHAEAAHLPPGILDRSRDVASAAAALLALARAELRAGTVERTWELCREAAHIGRAVGDATVVADAATMIEGGAVGTWGFLAEQHALCREALAMLGDDTDPRRRERVQAQLAVTSSPWTRPPGGTDAPGADRPLDAEDRFEELFARRNALVNAGHAQDRLALADDAMSLAARAGDDGHLAWGTLWRLDALYQLGRRVEINAELMRLTGISRRLREPVWAWRVAAARASLALLDGRHADVRALADEARRAGTACGLEEAPFVDLVLRSSLAVQTGSGLTEVEEQVRRVLVDAPFFAYGWHAQILAAMGRTGEALDIWQALAPQLDALPRESPEWLVASAGHADLCSLAGDVASAARLYETLLPLASLHVTAGAMTPYEGPVSLYLGRLAGQLGEHATARMHLEDAVRRSVAIHAPVFAYAARDQLKALGPAAGPLTAREREIAGLIAQGTTNREIAAYLVLSERTVENHVSHILRKLDLRSRTAIAAWVARHGRSSDPPSPSAPLG
jgi:DNA-binding CsgD family transcriptional regulator